MVAEILAGDPQWEPVESRSVWERFHEATKLRSFDLEAIAKGWSSFRVPGRFSAARDCEGLAELRLDASSNLPLHRVVACLESARRPLDGPLANHVYPVDVYVGVLSSKDGNSQRTGCFYYFHPSRKRLFLVASASDVPAAFAPNAARFAIFLVIVGVFNRLAWRFGERAYRHALVAAGMVLERILKTAEQHGVAMFPVSDFVDDRLNAMVGLSGIEEASLFVVAVAG